VCYVNFQREEQGAMRAEGDLKVQINNTLMPMLGVYYPDTCSCGESFNCHIFAGRPDCANE